MYALFIYLLSSWLIHSSQVKGLSSQIGYVLSYTTDFVYIRSAFYNSKHNLPQKIIFGHTEFESPLIQEDKICIDLGCGKYKNAKLCALILDNGKEEFIYSD